MKHEKKNTASNRVVRETDQNIYRLRHTLRWRLTLFVFCVVLLSCLLTVALAIFLVLITPANSTLASLIFNPISFCAILLAVCALFGTLFAGVFGKYYLRPLKLLINATQEIRKGNFKVEIDPIDKRTEMGQLINSFNEMACELDGIELFRNDFINNFSHEFKTPIISIRGFAKELEKGELDPALRREYAHIIAEEADRLSKLSINVLELSKLENQQLITDKEVFYLDEQLRQCILLCEPIWTAKNIEVIPELEEVRFFGNEEILSHVWNNLLGNAMKFTPENGTVTVRLWVENGEAVATVSDTGQGMTEEVQARIFERFYQADPSHHNAGHGIGLTIAERAATLSGGSISVQSSPSHGSTFTVRLPVWSFE